MQASHFWNMMLPYFTIYSLLAIPLVSVATRHIYAILFGSFHFSYFCWTIWEVESLHEKIVIEYSSWYVVSCFIQPPTYRQTGGSLKKYVLGPLFIVVFFLSTYIHTRHMRNNCAMTLFYLRHVTSYDLQTNKYSLFYSMWKKKPIIFIEYFRANCV